MDKVDIKLLSAMEKNARVSLKNLARDLDVKTSTIYHRLHKLRESNILERFTIVINPEEIGLNLHALVSIQLKKMVIGKLDSMFLESFAKFISEQYNEVIFSSVGNDNLIYIIATFKNEKHFSSFKEKIGKNPYIEDFNCTIFSKILKGKKIFTFIGEICEDEDVDGEYFDDSKNKEKLKKKKIKKNTSEVFF